MKNMKKGFTLIELMIVVAIIAILAAVAVPRFSDQIKKSKDAKALAIVGAYRSAAGIAFADNDGNGVYDPGLDTYGGFNYLVNELIDAQTKKITYASDGTTTFADPGVSSEAAIEVGTATTASGITITGKANAPTIKMTLDISKGEITLNGGNDTKERAWADL